MKQRLGLHLRLFSSIIHVIEQAVRLELPFFQCFLLQQIQKKYIAPCETEIKSFLSLRRKHFSQTYVHGSYWINLARIDQRKSYYLLDKELALAQKLEFTHFIIHPGSAKEYEDPIKGIDTMVRVLNRVIKKYPMITIVIENTPHGKKTIGNDINDLLCIKEKLQQPEKIKFCIDTAHAYGYGYDIVNEGEAFIDLLEKTIGIDSIALIHLNDTKETLGMKKDHHEIIGKGSIGETALKRFVLHKKLNHIPLLMELPPTTEIEQITLINRLKKWNQKEIE